MKRKILASVSVLLVSGSAAVAAPATTTVVNNNPTYNAPVYVDTSETGYAQGNWNGFYAGAGLGYAWGQFHTKFRGDNGEVSNNATTKMSDLNPMGIFGYSHTFNRFYLGGELDVGGFTGNSGEKTLTSSVDNSSYTVTTRPTWSLTPSILLGGLITPKWLIYGRLGAPFMGIDGTQSAQATIGGDTTTIEHEMRHDYGVGAMGGVGVGYSFTPHLNLRAEDDYSYVWGPSDSLYIGQVNSSTSVEGHYNEVLASLSYVF